MGALKDILIALITSAAVLGFVQFMITRSDKKNDDLKDIKNDIEDLKNETKKANKDSVRLQLLFLLLMQPDENKEILEVAQHYFSDLKGNWYLSPMFHKWCKQRGINPEWFHYDEETE